ncbi:phage head closure protein [Macrococcus equipercicus]|uniref:Phage head closure protein n=1 Tax=Macrococcus equipercicus TaxID=69967 RepID=A0A9Q9BUQ6_9STAP|nr:phage head closure protein [Macrococcus equipercicus]UTH13298.1 phage head closure protein [Macrococcus equipercicus]
MPRFKKRQYTSEKVGQLDKRLTLYTTDDISDDGWSNTSETEVGKVWAELIDNRSVDYNATIQTGTNNLLQFRIRYKSGITTDMSVRYKGEAYDIKNILEADERQKYMYLVIERKTL